MTQIVKTVNNVIVNALYLTGELGTSETPDGFMLSTGLDLCNEIISKFSSDSIYVTFLTAIDFDFVVGQDTYSISDIVPSDITQDRVIDLSFANYEVPAASTTKLIYPIKIINKATYYNVTRQTNLLARPSFIFLNKQATQSFVTVYPIPDQPYHCTLQAKVMINSLTNQDNLLELSPFYYGFLKYAVARKFLAYYPSANWPQQNEDEYQDYYQILKNVNETDLTIRPTLTLTIRRSFFWANILSFP